MKFVKWLGIDSDMLKLSENIMNDFLGGDLQYLETPLKINTFHHYIGQSAYISGKDQKNWLSIDDLHAYTYRI